MNSQLREGYIYGIRQTGSVYLKIGKSMVEPKYRVATLQTGNPTPLVLEFFFKTYNLDVAEQYAHQVLAKRRTNGEWFNVPWFARRRVRRQVQLACGRACTNMLDTLFWKNREATYNPDAIAALHRFGESQFYASSEARLRTRLRLAVSPYLWRWRASRWPRILDKTADAMVIVWALLVLS